MVYGSQLQKLFLLAYKILHVTIKTLPNRKASLISLERQVRVLAARFTLFALSDGEHPLQLLLH